MSLSGLRSDWQLCVRLAACARLLSISVRYTANLVALHVLLTLLCVPRRRYPEIESGMVFLGLAGLRDPPRPEVAAAISDCTNAGIRVIVITGELRLRMLFFDG